MTPPPLARGHRLRRICRTPDREGLDTLSRTRGRPRCRPRSAPTRPRLCRDAAVRVSQCLRVVVGVLDQPVRGCGRHVTVHGTCAKASGRAGGRPVPSDALLRHGGFNLYLM
eukprot:2406237-Prymnesium_polylepis.1